jgi:tetratricopeptide (TPR) repeat protein
MRQSWMSPAASIVLFAAFGCASAPARAPVAPTPDLQPRLAAANALLRVGCFDCLTDAFREYDAIRTTPRADATFVDAATTGSIRSAALLGLRQRELGMADDGYLQRARDLAGATDAMRAAFAPLFDAIETIPWRVPQYLPKGSVTVNPIPFRELQAMREKQGEALKVRADVDELSAYIWMAFSCSSPVSRIETDALLAPLVQFRDAPFVQYRAATCARTDAKALTDLLDREPRFVEIEFYLSSAAIGARPMPLLDEAETHIKRAYEWHPQWPAAATSLGNLYMAAEETQLALDHYDRALRFASEHGEALMGRVRALSHLGRHDDAFKTIEQILAGNRWFAGEVLYWRAWNELQVSRIDEAWASVERAGQLWAGPDVSKLAGLIAMRRQQFDVARGKFEAGRQQSATDCEMMFLLGTVHAELRGWVPMADVFVSTEECLQGSQRQLTQDIVRIQNSKRAPERKAKLVAKREQQIRTNGRMIATSWFNTAVAYFNLSQKTQARQYAEKVSDDEQYGERARELLSRLEK